LSVDELVDEICRAGRKARHVGGVDHIIDTIVAERRPGDVVVIMSNGGFDNIHRRLLARLRESGQPQTEGAA
jgi:UDP-N-acetylmuramate: L-alanyl-gamma-D-glutamyl-meso-diaminopimelate ligase